MAEGKFKPFSFYIPEQDTQLLQFLAYQSNMSLSMRLLMKAFIAGNRGLSEDISTMDLADLIRAVKVDPSVLDGRNYRGRGNQVLQEARETAFIERHGQAVNGTYAPEQVFGSHSGNADANVQVNTHVPEPAREQPVQPGSASAQLETVLVRDMAEDSSREPVASETAVPERAAEQQVQAYEPPVQQHAEQPPMPPEAQTQALQSQPVQQPLVQPAQTQAADDDLDPMSMMGDEY